MLKGIINIMRVKIPRVGTGDGEINDESKLLDIYQRLNDDIDDRVKPIADNIGIMG